MVDMHSLACEFLQVRLELDRMQRKNTDSLASHESSAHVRKWYCDDQY